MEKSGVMSIKRKIRHRSCWWHWQCTSELCKRSWVVPCHEHGSTFELCLRKWTTSAPQHQVGLH